MDILWEYEGEYPFSYTSIRFQVHGKQVVKAAVDGIPVQLQGNTIVTSKFRSLNLALE
jgi:alpha-glucosidase